MPESSILPDSWKVPEAFHDRLGAVGGRQRAMAADGHLLLILHAAPEPGEQLRVAIFFWRDRDGNWVSSDLGSGDESLVKHLEQYEQRLVKLDQLEETAQSAESYFEVLESLTPLERSASHMYQVLQEARKLCPDYREIIDLRDRAYAVKRTADLLFSATRNALDLIVAKQAEKQTQASHKMAIASHRLNVLAAFFFPIITLAAVLGMDVSKLAAMVGMEPELGQSSAVVTAIFLVMILGCLGVGWQLMKIINRPPPR